MTSWLSRGVAACSLSLALFACTFGDDDRQTSSPPPAPAPSHGSATPSASATTTPPPPPPASTSSSSSSGSSSSSSSSSGGGPPGSCVPNAVCGGIESCEDDHYACPSGQSGVLYCDCDGGATDPSAHLYCRIYC